MRNVTYKAAQLIIPEYNMQMSDSVSSGSTDMGDLCCVMPVVHPYAGGCSGRGHGDDYQIADPVAACVASAKLQVGMLYVLLSDDAKEAKKVISEYKPMFASKEEYLEFLDNLTTSGDRIEYTEDIATITLKQSV